MIHNWQPVLRHFNNDNLSDLFYQAAVLSKLPFAVWRYPKSLEKQAIVGLSAEVQKPVFRFKQKKPGFVIAPFFKNNDTGPCYINANYFINGKSCFFLSEDNGYNQSDIQKNKLAFEKHINASPINRTF